MSKYNILHLTDLHLHNIDDNSQEYLRKDYYKSYINSLVSLIKEEKISIDFIAITGDFVDRFRKDNFPHAKEILKYLYIELGINQKNIGVCIGNHDFDRTLDNDGKFKEARSEFNNFSIEYVNGYNKIGEGEYFTISEVDNETAFIALDSTYKKNGDTPGNLTDDEINYLIKAIQDLNLNKYERVLITSHYPLINFPQYPFPNIDGWYDSHFWKSGSFLRISIEKVLVKSLKIWFFGDTHQPGTMSFGSSCYVMSGRFGTKIDKIDASTIKYISNLKRQATIVSIDEQSVKTDVLQFYGFEHNESKLRGTWGRGHKDVNEIDLIRPKIVNAKIEDDIIESIVSKKLYRFGRFSTNNEYDILGWIFINDLLNDNSLLSRIINSCKTDWLDKSDDFLSGETLYVGIDYWGGIIASHLSIMTNSKNLPIPSQGKHYSKSELLVQNSTLFENKFANLVFIVDVLNTGKTLLEQIEQVKEALDLEDEITISCVSVISDIKQPKDKGLGSLKNFITFCGNLQQPIVPKDFLPPESILPRKKYFTE